MLSGRVKRNRLGLPADTNLREVVDDVSPSDSTSNVGSRAVARRAILQAEATSLERWQTFQKEELALQIKRKP